MSTTSQTADAVPAPKPAWIVGAWQDWLLIIATPAVLLPLFAFAKNLTQVHTLTAFATMLALGHHLPGMMRAYGDRALFRRFRWRFILAPIFLVTASVGFALNDMNTVLMLAFLWGAWHWCMQSYGFMRIYDGKKKSVDRITANLDRAMCVAWFGFALFLSPRPFYNIVLHYHQSGGVLPSAGLLAGFRYAWLAGTFLVTALFLLNLFRHYRAGRPPSAVKLVLMVVTFTYYWYTLALVPNALVAYALFEMYHDIQYLTIVWLFNRRRAATDQQVGGFTRYLFRQRGSLMLLYVGMCLAYGSFDYGARVMEDEMFRKIALALVVASSMLHFYYDGFIWKLREASTGGTLGLDTAKARARTFQLSPAVRHAMFWSLFIIPMIIFGKLESKGQRSDRATQARMLAELMPENPSAQAMLCGMLVELGSFDEAVEACRKVRELDAGSAVALNSLANVHLSKGELDQAEALFTQAIAKRPELMEAYVGYGTVLARRGKLDDAVAQFEKAILLGRQKTPKQKAVVYSNLGKAQFEKQDFQAALDAFQRAQKLNPELAEIARSLGVTYLRLERFEEGNRWMKAAMEAAPQDIVVLLGRVECLNKLNRGDDAIAVLEGVVERMPRSPEAVLALARQYRQGNKLREALTQYTQVARLTPQDPRPWIEGGKIHLMIKNYDQAITLFEQAVKAAPDLVDGHYFMGSARSLQQRYNEAIPHLQRALKIDPQFEPARKALDRIRKHQAGGNP